MELQCNQGTLPPFPARRASMADDPLTDAEVRRLAAVPTGAAWLSGIAVGLLLIAWFLIWLLIYIPRGAIG